jgi:[ribosomal protein S18]-alanine N-acetyltransferase
VIAFTAMTHAHLDAVSDIEIVSHHTPWTRRNFTDSLDGGHAATVMLEDGSVLGYAVVMPLPGEAELLNITIAPEARRTGLGRQLLEHVCADARALGAQRMFLEVRSSNTPARTLYAHNGFAEVGLRKAYYAAAEDGREDAILMAKDL